VTAANGQRTPRRAFELSLVLALLALGSVPDGMVYPGLADLTITRFDITISRASWFTLMPTLGAIASSFFLPRLVRAWSPLAILRVASLVEAALLAAVWLDVPFQVVVLLRCLSGACDLAGIAATLRMAARVAGPDHRARAFGWMGTAIMGGLLGGIALGTFVPTSWVILVAAAVLVLLALLTYPVERIAPSVHDPDPPRESADRDRTRVRQRVMASILVASDRGLAAVLASAVPLVVPQLLHGGTSDPKRIAGTILGLSMLGMVIGGPMVGGFVDRLGPLRIRLAGAFVFGLGVVGTVFVSPMGSGAMIAAAACAGVGAAPLFSAALSIGTHDRTSTGVYGAIQAAGQGGYALGSAALLLTDTIAADELLTGAAILYLAVNAAAAWVLRRR
jgi:predicted MFS family arabinose efflux permease